MADEEGDPDWLVAFKAPSTATVMLSDSSPENSPKRTAPQEEKKDSSDCAGSTDAAAQIKGKQPTATRRNSLTSTLSKHEEGPSMGEKQDKPPKRSVSQRLPLILSDKVQRSKALVECDGDSIDLSGDIGAVGRIVISNSPTGNQDLLLDLKGTVYKSTIVPSRTFCVVSMGQTEAKIEAIMNDFIQLEPHSNLFEAETMMEGTLDGFTFDSDGEGDRLHELHASQNDQNNENEDQPKSKTKRKAAAKPAAKGQKKAKVAKKGAKKTQSTKRAKKSKK
ncbi:hypothetical protein ACQ4PT_053717 [Festuca glaucescens]